MTLSVAACVLSDAGCARENNEDRGRVVHPGDAAERARRGVLAIVADGMGGHSAGEVASELAVDVVHRSYYQADGAAPEALSAAVRAANQAIFERAAADGRLHGMGTTCTALAICGDQAHAVNVGDSRLYLVREGRIYQMTADDSAVGRMVAQGLLSRSEARQHADRNVILRALGTRRDVEVSAWERPLPVRAGDCFVLCSDGLTDLVEDEEVLAAVDGRSESEACQTLVDLARARGGFDNITVAVLRVGAGGDEEPVRETRVVRQRS